MRRKGRYISETFIKRDDARRWATEAEGRIDRGETPTPSRAAKLKTFAELIDLHIADMKSVGKAPRRSKAATLKMLRTRLGKKKIAQLDRQVFIDFGRERASEGAGPMTLSIDIGAIKLVLSHAVAVHGLSVSVEPINMARLALKRLGLVGKGVERDRRPTEDEIERLITHFEANPRQIIPMGCIIRFAIATAMRQEEIFRVIWEDYVARTKMLTIRDRKDPREKSGNDQRIPLLSVSGFDAVALIDGDRDLETGRLGRSFRREPFERLSRYPGNRHRRLDHGRPHGRLATRDVLGSGAGSHRRHSQSDRRDAALL